MNAWQVFLGVVIGGVLSFAIACEVGAVFGRIDRPRSSYKPSIPKGEKLER